jgi:polyhydroxyalkanoate synthase
MTSNLPPVDAEEYLENLMRAGQDAMKQFDDALVSAAGVGTRAAGSGRLFFPFTLIADLQREYFKQLWQFWNSMFLQTFAGGAHSSVALARGDRRFKDDAWQEMPYYDLLKQSYCLAQGSCMSSLTGRRLTTRRNCSFGFMPASLLTR